MECSREGRRAARDGAWLEVVRLAELIDADPDAMWRAGRLAKWAEALERLGRPAEAAQIRARTEPTPVRTVQVRFGRELELVGIEVRQWTEVPARDACDLVKLLGARMGHGHQPASPRQQLPRPAE